MTNLNLNDLALGVDSGRMAVLFTSPTRQEFLNELMDALTLTPDKSVLEVAGGLAIRVRPGAQYAVGVNKPSEADMRYRNMTCNSAMTLVSNHYGDQWHSEAGKWLTDDEGDPEWTLATGKWLFVGDPCYMVDWSPENWARMYDGWFTPEGNAIVDMRRNSGINGEDLVVANTLWGDGVYPVNLELDDEGYVSFLAVHFEWTDLDDDEEDDWDTIRAGDADWDDAPWQYGYDEPDRADMAWEDDCYEFPLE